MPQTRQLISAVGLPKLTTGLRESNIEFMQRIEQHGKLAKTAGHVEELLLCNKFLFPIVNTCLSYEDIARLSYAMVHGWQIFTSCIFSELRAVHFRPTFKISTKAKSCVEVW